MSSNQNAPTNTVLTPTEAIAQYESAVTTEPTAANYLELGVAYYIAKRFEEALNAFQKTVEIDPKQAYGHYYLGVLYAAFGQRDKATQEMESVLTVSTNQMLRDQAKTRIPGVRSLADLGDN